MVQLLGLTILSSFITIILLVPFIDFLYRIKLQRQNQITRDPFNKKTPIFDKFNSWKVGTPMGGGLLIIIVVSILALWSYGILNVLTNGWVITTLFISFIGFGLLGLYDDLKKLTNKKSSFFGLRLRYKFIIQVLLALIISFILYFKLGYGFIFIRGFGLLTLGFLAIPFFTLVIVSFANAANITDGLDGLCSGLFLISLTTFFAITSEQIDRSLGIFIAILMGAVGAFLYFNIYKARLWLGDVGSLSLGAVLATSGLLTGKVLALVVIGGVFVLEVGYSLLQMIFKKYFHKKLFAVAPLHLWFQNKGWDEPKIVMRAWLLGFFFAILGLFIALVK